MAISDDYPILDFIRDQLGQQMVDEVQKHFSGVRICIPSDYNKLRQDTALVQKLGWEAATRLAKAVGYFKGDIPIADTKGLALLRLTQEYSAEDLIRAKELSMREIAIRLSVHERTIWRVRARLKREELPDVILMLQRGMQLAEVANFTIISEKEIVALRKKLTDDGKLPAFRKAA